MQPQPLAWSLQDTRHGLAMCALDVGPFPRLEGIGANQLSARPPCKALEGHFAGSRGPHHRRFTEGATEALRRRWFTQEPAVGGNPGLRPCLSRACSGQRTAPPVD